MFGYFKQDTAAAPPPPLATPCSRSRCILAALGKTCWFNSVRLTAVAVYRHAGSCCWMPVVAIGDIDYALLFFMSTGIIYTVHATNLVWVRGTHSIGIAGHGAEICEQKNQRASRTQTREPGSGGSYMFFIINFYPPADW